MKIKTPILLLSLILVTVIILTILGPEEATLGTNARVVYLHGAWVWAALAAFIFAGVFGLIGLYKKITGKDAINVHQWSRSLGRTGLVFWITYLPISLWAMQANWNGLFLAEPRWRIAVVFSVAGLLLQTGLSFLPVSWSSFWNLTYVTTLFLALQTTDKVMHPPQPMLDSDAWRIQFFFWGLSFLLTLAAWQVARLFKSLER